MSRRIRCLLPGILRPTLSLMLSAGCFSPTGTAASGTDSDTSSTQAPLTSSTGDDTTSATTGTSDASQSSGADTSTGAAASTSGDTGNTDGGATTDATSASGDPEFCGDGIIQIGEACDDGPANGDARPCRSDCELAVCGDSLICSDCAPAETCDDGNQIDDDACDLACQTTSCGNQSVEPGEECDDGNQIAGDGCSPRCLFEQQLLFVSSIKLSGDINGLAAADQVCAGLAAPYFDLRRKFVAFMSDSNDSAGARIGVSSFPYKTPSGVLIAGSTQDLLDGSIAAPLIETEDGVAQPISANCDGLSGVWTGTIAMGQGVSDTCEDWHTLEGMGLAGNFSLVDGKWTQQCNLPCASLLRIYCIETVL
jgi:cysteine-rich repeat protein